MTIVQLTEEMKQHLSNLSNGYSKVNKALSFASDNGNLLIDIMNGEVGNAHDPLQSILTYSFDEETPLMEEFVEEISNKDTVLQPMDESNIFELFEEGLEQIHLALKEIKDTLRADIDLMSQFMSFISSSGYNPFQLYGVRTYVSQFGKFKEASLKELKLHSYNS